MSYRHQDNVQAELKQLWGGTEIPPLTPEQITVALQLWQKIKAMKLREEKMATSQQQPTEQLQ